MATNEAEVAVEERELTQFEQRETYLSILLSDDFFPGGLGGPEQTPLPDESEDLQRVAKGEESLRRLTTILDEYQEQANLLDPHLEGIVVPVVDALQYMAKGATSNVEAGKRFCESTSVQRLARLLYCYTKVRGYKTIVHFFPHAVEDMLPTLSLLECQQAAEVTSTWELRYILLLWLSLVCMIPFDLYKFDVEIASSVEQHHDTAYRVQSIGRHYLGSAGKERDAASIVLGRLFQRKDACSAPLRDFLQWSHDKLNSLPDPAIFIATGILQTLCEVVKVSSQQALKAHIASIESIVALYSTDLEDVRQASGRYNIVQPFHYSNNSLINKYKAKMACRLGLKALKPRKRRSFAKNVIITTLISKPETLAATENSRKTFENDEEEDFEVSEDIDRHIATLLDALQDKDTVVRYSAAKGISRLSARLPTSFIEQVSDAVTDLFSVNIPDLLGKKEDLSNVSEYTWQGCCLALAELARRGLLSGHLLTDKLEWVEKALTFDVRRGAHSVGTGVRDAACYILWAIARAHDAEAIRPKAVQLSHRLVCVALLDRDVSIRRAASAAFQESVGRLNLFEHGIDIIRKTDFYAVGVRRNAFLLCAPQVAVHPNYRVAILDHLLNTSLVHWDPSMRELAATAIARVTDIDVEGLVPSTVEHLASRCRSGDTAILHGALCALTELADVCHRSNDGDLQAFRKIIFAALDFVPRHAIRSLSPPLVVCTACRLIRHSVTRESLDREGPASWEVFIEAALQRQEEQTQVAAAEALATVSSLLDCGERIETVMNDWRSLSTNRQQSNVRALGLYHYRSHTRSLFVRTILFLVSIVRQRSSSYSNNVETRRNAFEAMANMIVGLGDNIDWTLDEEISATVFRVMMDGLDDYTADARGDVGSWVRLACLTGMRKVLHFLISTSQMPLTHWIDQKLFHAICAGYCKEMLERIDSVRSQATKECLSIAGLWKDHPSLHPKFAGLDLFAPLLSSDNLEKVTDPVWFLPQVITLLLVSEYRAELLKGITLCIGGQKELSNRVVSRGLSTFLLSEENSRQYGPNLFVEDIVRFAASNIKTNRYFVPAIQTLNSLFEEDVMEEVGKDTEEGKLSLLKAAELTCRNVSGIKSIARVMASMQYTINLLSIPALQEQSFARLALFLLHPFPTVRSSTAESLYTCAQDHLDEVNDEAEDILLSTRWAQTEPEVLRPIVDSLITQLTHRT